MARLVLSLHSTCVPLRLAPLAKEAQKRPSTQQRRLRCVSASHSDPWFSCAVLASGSGSFTLPGSFCCCRRCTMKHAHTERRATTTKAPAAMPTMRDTLRSDDESDAIVSTAMVGSDSTVMPRADEAVSAVPRLEESEVRIAANHEGTYPAMQTVSSLAY